MFGQVYVVPANFVNRAEVEGYVRRGRSATCPYMMDYLSNQTVQKLLA